MRSALTWLLAAGSLLVCSVALAQDQQAPEPMQGPSSVPEAPESEESRSSLEPAITQPGKTPGEETVLEEDEEPKGPLIPPANDTLSGHVALSPGVALAMPFGNLADGIPQSDVATTGWGLFLDAGVGVSRTVAVGLWGQMLSFGSPDDCPSCSLSSFAFGPFVRYHLVQGVRFDPWMSAGLGYRIANLDGGRHEGSYSGLEWLRLQMGGDWYPFDVLGFGPLLELDMGVFGARPDGSRDAGTHWQFLTGLRITLDLPGK